LRSGACCADDTTASSGLPSSEPGKLAGTRGWVKRDRTAPGRVRCGSDCTTTRYRESTNGDPTGPVACPGSIPAELIPDPRLHAVSRLQRRTPCEAQFSRPPALRPIVFSCARFRAQCRNHRRAKEFARPLLLTARPSDFSDHFSPIDFSTTRP
jgi:hypothetical protein